MGLTIAKNEIALDAIVYTCAASRTCFLINMHIGLECHETIYLVAKRHFKNEKARARPSSRHRQTTRQQQETHRYLVLQYEAGAFALFFPPARYYSAICYDFAMSCFLYPLGLPIMEKARAPSLMPLAFFDIKSSESSKRQN